MRNNNAFEGLVTIRPFFCTLKQQQIDNPMRVTTISFLRTPLKACTWQ